MMTSEERREVAERLRKAKRDCEKRGYPWMTDDLILALGYERDYMADDGIFDRLADLIDPTCSAVAHDNLNETCGMGDVWYTCSECGEMLCANDEYMPPYCPECGSRVVQDGE